jgi:hypothetical protein
MARWNQAYAIRRAVDGCGPVKAELRTAGIATCGPLLPGSGRARPFDGIVPGIRPVDLYASPYSDDSGLS